MRLADISQWNIWLWLIKDSIHVLAVILWIELVLATQHGDEIISILEGEQNAKIRCDYDFVMKWSHEVSHSPFVSPPVIHDVDADGKDEVIAVTHSETLTVIDASTGTLHHQRLWPITLFDKTFLTSPILHDVDRDGMLDIVLVSSSAQILVHNYKGQPLTIASFQIPPVFVDIMWHTKVISLSHTNIHDLILHSAPQESQEVGYLAVDPHVLGTPILADVNADSIIEELIIPVSYYFDMDDYLDESDLFTKRGVTQANITNYLVSSVVYYNMTSGAIISTVHLDLTMKNSPYPAYLPHSPTVIDLDSIGGPLETVVATLAGNLHVIDSGGKHRPGFPISINPSSVQVIAADMSSDGQINILVADLSGNLICLNKRGETVWESDVDGSPVGHLRLLDLSLGQLTVVVTIDTGAIYFVNSTTGEVYTHRSALRSQSPSASVSITHLNPSSLSMTYVSLDEDGSLFFTSHDRACKTHIPIGETSYIQVMSHDLINQSPGLELLIATKDGTLLCYGRDGPMTSEDITERGMKGSYNDFTVPYPTVYFMNSLLAHERYESPGNYTINVMSPRKPSHGHMIVQVTNQHGQLSRQIVPIRFHMDSLCDLQWILLLSSASFLTLMLVLHTFPSNMLPFTHQNKAS